jgi:hypothetical protein
MPIELRWIEWLVDAAVEAARAARKGRTKSRPVPQRPRVTLRPGPDTPLWNELVRQLRPHLRKYGAKAQFARLLGLPRQRLHDCLKAGSACADAERTLLMLGWLGFFQRGGELVPVVRPGRPSRRRGSAPVPGNV